VKYLALLPVVLLLSACSENELVTCLDNPEQARKELSIYSGKGKDINDFMTAVNKDQHYGECFIRQLDIAKDANLKQKAQKVLDFTSGTIVYAADKKKADLTDIDRPGTRLPSRTVADGKGDCEDKAALSAVMLRELGVKTYVIERPANFKGIGHIFLGVKANYKTMLKCGGEYVIAFDPTLENAKIGDEEYGLSEVKNASCVEI
jgi:hypothetical protein